MQALRVQLRGQALDEGVHAVTEGQERRLLGSARHPIGGGGGRLPPCLDPTDQAAVLLLQFQVVREQQAHAQPLGVAKKYARQEGAGELIDGFLAEAAVNEGGDALVLRAGLGRQRDLARHAQLAHGAEQAAAGESAAVGGDDAGQARRERVQLPVGKHIGAILGVVAAD